MIIFICMSICKKYNITRQSWLIPVYTLYASKETFFKLWSNEWTIGREGIEGVKLNTKKHRTLSLASFMRYAHHHHIQQVFIWLTLSLICLKTVYTVNNMDSGMILNRISYYLIIILLHFITGIVYYKLYWRIVQCVHNIEKLDRVSRCAGSKACKYHANSNSTKNLVSCLLNFERKGRLCYDKEQNSSITM